MDDFYIDLWPSSPVSLSFSRVRDSLDWRIRKLADQVLCWEAIGPQCSTSQAYTLPQHSRTGGEHTTCPSLLLKEIQAASSLRASSPNLPNPSSSHYRNTWVEPLLCMKLLCLRVNWPSATEQVFWDSLRTCSLEDAGEKRLGDSRGLVGCKKAMPCEANTRELIRIY